MNRTYYLFLLLFLCYSCKEVTKDSVYIEAEKDTIVYGETYLAKLFVENNKNFAPDFFIIYENDTFQLAFDESENCAIFRSRAKPGLKTYPGFVNYLDKNNNRINLEFKIEFTVLPETAP